MVSPYPGVNGCHDGAIGTLGCWVFLTRPSPSKVTLSFIAYSTNSSGQTLASFGFTNGSKYSVVASDPCCIQTKVSNNFTNIRLADALGSGFSLLLLALEGSRAFNERLELLLHRVVLNMPESASVLWLVRHYHD